MGIEEFTSLNSKDLVKIWYLSLGQKMINKKVVK